jgi:hypothetical protein
MKPHCKKCNNRLTEQDITTLADFLTAGQESGGKLTRREIITFRRLIALKVSEDKE